MRTPGGRRGMMPAIALIGIVMASGCTPAATKGTMPPPGPDGVVDASTAPDFLAVAGRDGGIVGYARKEDVLGPHASTVPVYGDDLRTVVGQMVPGRGFVPTGVDPSAVPTLAVQVGPSSGPSAKLNGQVVLYVRNDATTQAWVTVLVDEQPWDTTGFWGQNMAVGCYAMPAGSRLVMLDRAPEQAGASVIRQIYVRGQENDPPSLWITIGGDGFIQQGTGAPAWWGEPQSC